MTIPETITGRDWEALTEDQKAEWSASPANAGKTGVARVLENKQFNASQDDIPIGVNFMHRDGCVYIDTTDRKWARVSRNKWIVMNEDGVFIHHEEPK
jgi:hypothetical protein